jgi:hypothetical protein
MNRKVPRPRRLSKARASIDAQFTQMSSDPAYQVEAVQIAEEFAKADWEASRIAERKA